MPLGESCVAHIENDAELFPTFMLISLSNDNMDLVSSGAMSIRREVVMQINAIESGDGGKRERESGTEEEKEREKVRDGDKRGRESSGSGYTGTINYCGNLHIRNLSPP